MEFFRPLGRAGLAWKSLRLAAESTAVWLPLWIIAVARFVAMLLLFSFYAPWLAGVGVPIVEWLGGEQATHYPGHLFALPAMYSRAKLFVAVLVASIAVGAAVVGFAACFTRREFAPAWSLAIRSAPKLMLLSIMGVAAILGVTTAFERFGPRVLPQRLLDPGTFAVHLGCEVLVHVLFAYSVAAVVLLQRSLGGAISLSFHLALRNPLTTLILIGVPGLLLHLGSRALDAWNPIDIGLTPDWISVGILMRILLELAENFIVLGSTTRVFVSRVKLAP